ncbi:MAG: response regulator [Nitrospirales bacterium]
MARILIIDDDEPLRRMLARALAREGFEVLVAADGQEGVRLHRAHSADLIITDILMPDQEGLETIAQLRRDSPAVKIIAISGAGDHLGLDVLEVAKRLGAATAIRKPVELPLLLQVVRDTLQTPPHLTAHR